MACQNPQKIRNGQVKKSPFIQSIIVIAWHGSEELRTP
jgi:hypothetical protein